MKWTQQQGAAASAIRNYAFAYDRASQLTDATVTDDGANVLKTCSWQYDPAGNRVRESVDTGSTYAQFNDLNQLTQLGGAGTTLIEGTTDEPASVSVNGGPALVTGLPGGDFLFRREIPVSEGGNTVTIEATDASGNTATQSYSIVVGGVQKVLEYDLNGNLRFEKDDQGIVLREFQWDARNRLVAIIDGTHTSEFTYDALDRRVRIVEKENGIAVSDATYLWAGGEIVQKRDSTAITVLRNYFENGFTEGGSSYFYAKDHLGSIREVVAADGSTIEARYEYTPWGEVTKTGGTGVESDFLYTGHFHHAPTGQHLALYRAYDSETGRWPSRDPIERITGDMAELLPEGPNLYGYVGNSPVNRVDVLGLAYSDYGPSGLNACERDLIDNSSLWQNFQAMQARNTAFDAVSDSKYNGTRYNGSGDAVRHCVWNCEMARSNGQEWAKRAGDCHETGSTEPDETTMDLFNNQVGRDLAPKNRGGRNRKSCKSLCEDALSKGKLKVLPRGRWK